MSGAGEFRLVFALARKNQNGTYGICRGCGGRIPRRRLEALPTAALCVGCQEQREDACLPAVPACRSGRGGQARAA